MRHKLTEPEPVLHAPRPRLLLLDRRLLNEQPLDHVNTLLDRRLLLLHHLLLGGQFGGQLLVGPHQLFDPALLLLQIVLHSARFRCKRGTRQINIKINKKKSTRQRSSVNISNQIRCNHLTPVFRSRVRAQLQRLLNKSNSTTILTLVCYFRMLLYR